MAVEVDVAAFRHGRLQLQHPVHAARMLQRYHGDEEEEEETTREEERTRERRVGRGVVRKARREARGVEFPRNA